MAGSSPSHQELRARVLAELLGGSITAVEAAARLGLSVRHVRRLVRAFVQHGPQALVHGNRGRLSPRRLPAPLRARLVELACTTYVGFSQKEMVLLLAQREGLRVAPSTLRRVLLEAGLRSPRGVRRLPVGTMPVGFDLTNRRVQLVVLHGADFRESFFNQTVERYRREQPSALTLEMDLSLFLAAARLEPGRQPDGFIFHVGRCGATLLANTLSLADEHLVLKESPAVNALVTGLISATDEKRRRERRVLLELALPFMFRPSRGREQRLIFSLTSWSSRLAGTLLEIFPSARAVFLFDTPQAVVASMLAGPPGWKNLMERSLAVQARFFPSLATVPPDRRPEPIVFYTHAWCSAVQAALALPADRLLLVPFQALLTQPERVLERVLAQLQLQPEASAFNVMLQALQAGSRDSNHFPGSEFGGGASRTQLTEAQQAEVSAIVGDLLARLESRSVELCTT